MSAAAFVARKGMAVFGVRYERGQAVDMEAVPPELRRRLVDQKRVVPRATAPSAPASPAASPAVGQKKGGWASTAQKPGARCGDHGGRMRNGKPCGRVSFGLCQHHKN